MAVNDLLDRDEDRPAYVRFERIAVKDAAASLEAGCYKSKDEDMIYVTPPYSKDEYTSEVNVYFRKKEVDVQKGRVPQKHLELWKEAYSRWQKGQEPPLDGTSVRNWSAISPAQCANLISAGCKTIEDLAQANDEAVRRLGMGAQDLRNKAKAYLQAAKDHGPLIMEVSQLKNENKQLQGTIDSLQEQITRLQIQAEAQGEETVKPLTGNAATPYNRAPEEKIAESEGEAQKQLRAMLSIEYEKKFGKKPAGRMKAETIQAKLRE